MQKFLFFSGGTALNTIESIFKTFTDAVYVLPISDNGGSSSVIMDVIGGPSIGDIRSRIVRLADDSTVEARAVSSLLMYRLPLDSDESKREWLAIVEGTHDLWSSISEPYKETIRAFLVHFNTEVLRQASKKQFTFSCGSIGNFFLTGARIFFNSLETSLFWFSRVVRIPSNSSVMPIINTNSTIHIGVELENGVIIHGQHEISHPTSSSTSLSSPRFHSNPLPPSPRLYHPQLAVYLQRLQHSPQHLFYPPSFPVSAFNNSSLLPSSQYPHSPSSYSSRSFSPRPPQPAELHSLIPPPTPIPHPSSSSSSSSADSSSLSPTKISQLHRSASLPTNSLLPNELIEQQKKAAQHNNLVVEKNGHTPLEAKIKRLFYLNEDRQEILPPCNPTVLAKIRQQDTIVYSIGSLWTSIIPCLVLKGVGEEISVKKGRKILILNGYPDRETNNFTALDYVSAITAALNRYGALNHPASKYITHLIWVEGSKVEVEEDEDAMRAQEIACVRIVRMRACAEETPSYDEALLVQCLADLGSLPSSSDSTNGNESTNGNGLTNNGSNGHGSTNGNLHSIVE